MDYEVSKNSVCVCAMRLPNRKKHVLAIQLEEGGEIYAVGTFRNESYAKWFIEILAVMMGEEE